MHHNPPFSGWLKISGPQLIFADKIGLLSSPFGCIRLNGLFRLVKIEKLFNTSNNNYKYLISSLLLALKSGLSRIVDQQLLSSGSANDSILIVFCTADKQIYYRNSAGPTTPVVLFDPNLAGIVRAKNYLLDYTIIR